MAKTNSPRDEYFARVVPVLGTGLSGHAVSVDDGGRAALIIEHLAASMLGSLHLDADDTAPWDMHQPARDTRAFLAWKNPHASPRDVARDACAFRVTTSWSNAGRVAFSDDGLSAHVALPRDAFGWMDVSTEAARMIRTHLLGTSHAGTATSRGHALWPFALSAAPLTPASPRAADLRGRHVLIVGAGSLGSEAMRALLHTGVRFTLVDDGKVSVFNPQRQWFGLGDAGRMKVEVLAQRVPGTRVNTIAGRDDSAWRQLLEADRPDVILLATGTHHHGPLARVAWELGIPHVAACCWPRARYWEVAVMLPREDTACLDCFRGHVWRGTPATPPITDEVSQFLYSDADEATRTRAYTDLVAEPATRTETFPAALTLARCAVEVLAKDRAPWFRRMQQERTLMLLGGNHAEQHADGSWAHGIERAGQVIRLGLDDVVGDDAQVECVACGRLLDVAFQRPSLPAFVDEAVG